MVGTEMVRIAPVFFFFFFEPIQEESSRYLVRLCTHSKRIAGYIGWLHDERMLLMKNVAVSEYGTTYNHGSVPLKSTDRKVFEYGVNAV